MYGSTIFNTRSSISMTTFASHIKSYTPQNQASYPTIHAAAHQGDQEAIEYFLQSQSIDTKDEEGNTPLLIALREAHLNLAQWLLKKGAEATISNKKRENALITLFRMEKKKKDRGHEQFILQVAKLLLQGGLNVNSCFAFNTATILMHVARQGNAALVQLFLKHGANPNLRNRKGQNALHIVFSKDEASEPMAQSRQNILEQLLYTSAFKMDINARDIKGQTPLIQASLCGSTDIAYLLKQGADPNVLDHLNHTAFDYLMHWYDQPFLLLESVLPALLTALRQSSQIHLSKNPIKDLLDRYLCDQYLVDCKTMRKKFHDQISSNACSKKTLLSLSEEMIHGKVNLSKRTMAFSKTLTLLLKREFVIPHQCLQVPSATERHKIIDILNEEDAADRSGRGDAFLYQTIIIHCKAQTRDIVQKSLQEAYRAWCVNSSLPLKYMESFFKLSEGERYFVDVVYDQKAQLKLLGTISIPNEVYFIIAGWLLKSAPDTSFAILSPETGRSLYHSKKY